MKSIRKEYGDDVRYVNENGEYHRTDGPAVEYADGNKYYYLDGKNYPYEEWRRIRKMLWLL